jgi:hypothetical protein
MPRSKRTSQAAWRDRNDNILLAHLQRARARTGGEPQTPREHSIADAAETIAVTLFRLRNELQQQETQSK